MGHLDRLRAFRGIVLSALVLAAAPLSGCKQDYGFSLKSPDAASGNGPGSAVQDNSWRGSFSYAAVGTTWKGMESPARMPSMQGDPITEFKLTAGTLPEGLRLDPKTGMISGMALADSRSSVKVTITGSGSRDGVKGSASTEVSFDLQDFPFRYARSSDTYEKRTAIDPNKPESMAGMIVEYRLKAGSVLPPGLALDSKTGEISGTPTQIVPEHAVTVERLNPAGSMEATLSLKVNDRAPKGLKYSQNPAEYVIGRAISPNVPSSDPAGGDIVSYSIVQGSLPKGLAFEPVTGVITGTPEELWINPVKVVIRGENTGGATTAELSLRVVEVAPSKLAYSENPATYIHGLDIMPNTPKNEGGAIARYDVNPALPLGLALDKATGRITGKPEVTAVRRDYVITGSNSGGQAQVALSLEVGELVQRQELADLAKNQVRPIDLVFVVDNSGSMSDKQKKLADGFASIAATYFKNPLLDICTLITTTDRDQGRGVKDSKGNYTYVRDRKVGCTVSGQAAGLTPAQQSAYVDGLIADFKTKVNVGTSGSGDEHPLKSLATVLFDQEKYSDALNTSVVNPWFRPKAFRYVVFLTDENNLFRNNSGYHADPNKSDLSYKQGAIIPSYALTLAGQPDARMGIEDYMAIASTKLGGAAAASDLGYTAFITVKDANNLARNLADLVASSQAKKLLANSTDILGDQASYVTALGTAMQGIVERVNAIKLSQTPYEPKLPNQLTYLKAEVRHANGSVMALAFPNDFKVIAPDRIELSSAVSSATVDGDKLAVSYMYYRAPQVGVTSSSVLASSSALAPGSVAAVMAPEDEAAPAPAPTDATRAPAGDAAAE